MGGGLGHFLRARFRRRCVGAATNGSGICRSGKKYPLVARGKSETKLAHGNFAGDPRRLLRFASLRAFEQTTRATAKPHLGRAPYLASWRRISCRIVGANWP